jgi:hypothetical protein
LPASDDAASARAEVERQLSELERLCRVTETGLVAGDWNGVACALRDARRVTHAMRNAMERSQDVRDEAFDLAVHARIKRVYDQREDQLQRLRTFHASVGQRLQTLSQWKVFARSIGAKRAPNRTLGVDRTG